MILKIIIIYKNFDKRYIFYDVKDVEEIKYYKDMFKIYSRKAGNFEITGYAMKDILDIKIEHL